MKKVLFPTDFSENSLSILPWAGGFCKTINAELVLLNVMLAPVVSLEQPLITAQEISEAQEDQIKDKLATIAAKISTKHDIVVSIKAQYGFPTEIIASVAKEKHFDLILLSAKGESNFLDKIFGNTTEKLFEESEIPILSIPSNLDYSTLKNVAFASSNIDNDAVQIFDLLALLKPQKTKVKLIHIIEGNTFEQETFEDFPNLEYIELGGEDKLETFSKYIENENIDLVCVKRYKLPFLYRLLNKSFTEDLFHNVRKPLLVFKDE